ncbi:hypothetical protein RQP46_011041 [Phenoliferia psychrophenolica]
MKELEAQLPDDTVSVSQQRFRTFYEWATGCATIVFDVLSLVPITAPYAPIAKVVLGVALLSTAGRQATDSCRTLKDYLREIYEANLRSREAQPKPFDDAMDGIFFELHDFVTNNFKTTLIGREFDLNRTIDSLTRSNSEALTEHVALVGIGGIGKTSLATSIAHNARAKTFGRPVFIRYPEQVIREELSKERIFLILDNLLDTSDETHADYFQYINALTDIPELTILITSRNHTFLHGDTFRKINGVALAGLSDAQSETLFLRAYLPNVDERQRADLLDRQRKDMLNLLGLLAGIPLAIIIVAKYADRTGLSLAIVVEHWKEGAGWANGVESRLTSLNFSLNLSFKDVTVKETGTMNLLHLLAELPAPMVESRGGRSVPIRRAITAITERSVGQKDSTSIPTVVRILQPVRDFILRYHSNPPIDTSSEIFRAITSDYFRSVKGTRAKEGELDLINFFRLIEMTEGTVGDNFEPARLHALLSCSWGYEEVKRQLLMLLQAGEIHYKCKAFDEAAAARGNAVKAYEAHLRRVGAE